MQRKWSSHLSLSPHSVDAVHESQMAELQSASAETENAIAMSVNDDLDQK